MGRRWGTLNRGKREWFGLGVSRSAEQKYLSPLQPRTTGSPQPWKSGSIRSPTTGVIVLGGGSRAQEGRITERSDVILVFIGEVPSVALMAQGRTIEMSVAYSVGHAVHEDRGVRSRGCRDSQEASRAQRGEDRSSYPDDARAPSMSHLRSRDSSAAIAVLREVPVSPWDARRIIDSWATNRVGYDRATLAMFGVTWPPQPGWKHRLVKRMVAGEIKIPEQLALTLR